MAISKKAYFYITFEHHIKITSWLVINFFISPVFTARSSYANAVFGIAILSVCLPVCHTRALWRNESRPTYCRYFVFRHHHRLVGDVHFHLEFSLNWPTPFEKRRLRQISAHNVWTVRASEKCSIISWIESLSRAFQRTTDEVRTLPLTPQRKAQIANLSFLWINLSSIE